MSDASKRVAARAYARVYLNVERGLWAWTMAARHHGEKFSAVWPRLDRDLSEYLEESQTRAFVGILGEAAPPRVLLTKSGLRKRGASGQFHILMGGVPKRVGVRVHATQPLRPSPAGRVGPGGAGGVRGTLRRN